MKLLRTLAFAGLALGLAALQPAVAQEKKTITIGATAGPNYDQVKLGIKPVLEKKGYTVKLVEFNDYVQPNIALAQGSLDANVFQHLVYLRKFAADKGLDLVDVAQVPVAPMGLYTKQRKSLADVREGDRITMANDPSNLARALFFLQQNGLIKVKADIDPLKATEKDVAENPHKLKLTPIEAAQVPRTLDDAAYAVVNGNFAIASGLKLSSALALEKTPEHYLNVVAVRAAEKDSSITREIVAAFHSPEYKAIIDQHFQGYARPAYLQ